MEVSRVFIIVLSAANAVVGEKEPSCGEGETAFENACYWTPTIYYQFYNFTEALVECQARGLQLASIHSQQEQEFIAGLLGGYAAWIGLTDLAVEGEFRWTDGTPLEFQYWRQGEPDGGDPHDCVHTYPSVAAWGDYACEYSYGFVCKGAPRII